jgi:hypothetical protein
VVTRRERGGEGPDTDYTPPVVLSICFVVVPVAPSVGEVVSWLALVVVFCSVLVSGIDVMTDCDDVCCCVVSVVCCCVVSCCEVDVGWFVLDNNVEDVNGSTELVCSVVCCDDVAGFSVEDVNGSTELVCSVVCCCDDVAGFSVEDVNGSTELVCFVVSTVTVVVSDVTVSFVGEVIPCPVVVPCSVVVETSSVVVETG